MSVNNLDHQNKKNKKQTFKYSKPRTHTHTKIPKPHTAVLKMQKTRHINPRSYLLGFFFHEFGHQKNNVIIRQKMKLKKKAQSKKLSRDKIRRYYQAGGCIFIEIGEKIISLSGSKFDTKKNKKQKKNTTCKLVGRRTHSAYKLLIHTEMRKYAIKNYALIFKSWH